MTDAELPNILRKLIHLSQHDDLVWFLDDKDEIHLTISCNDLFHWACSDGVEVTPQNIEMLEQAVKDCTAVIGDVGWIYADMLFACRVRGERPQPPARKDIPKEILPLIEACGPERSAEYYG